MCPQFESELAVADLLEFNSANNISTNLFCVSLKCQECA